MNKLHTLLLAFSTMTSATAWAEAPALQSPALATSSEAKESPFKKLMALLAKAKQQQAQGQAQGPVAPAPAVSSGQELVSLIKSQGLSFKDALEKMGVGVNKRFSKRLNGKRGQKLFLNRIKKEGLSWQDAAASLKPAAAAEAAPLASATCPGDPFDDFEKFLKANYTTDNAGALLAALVDSWQSILRNSSDSGLLQAFASCFTDVQNQIFGSMHTSCQTKYGTLLNQDQLNILITFQKAMALKDAATLTKICPTLTCTVFDATKSNADQISKDLISNLTCDFKTAYRLIEQSLSRDSFDNADILDTSAPKLTEKTYTGLTQWGQLQAKALQALEIALDYKMDRQGLGRLIYGGKTIAALATYDKDQITSDKDFLFACKKLDKNGEVVVDEYKVDKYSTLIDNVLTKVPAIFTSVFFEDPNDAGIKGDRVQANGRGYMVTNKETNQSLTLQLLAAAGEGSIDDRNELTSAEKPAAYYTRQLLNGEAPRDTWLSRNNYTIYNTALCAGPNGNIAEGRRGSRESSQETPSEERNIRPNNRNNVSWE